jgi:arginine/lysine/ornithine decarboxylase
LLGIARIFHAYFSQNMGKQNLSQNFGGLVTSNQTHAPAEQMAWHGFPDHADDTLDLDAQKMAVPTQVRLARCRIPCIQN